MPVCAIMSTDNSSSFDVAPHPAVNIEAIAAMQQQVLELWTGQCSQACAAAMVQLQDLQLVSMLLQPALQAAEILHHVSKNDAVCCCCCCLSPGLQTAAQFKRSIGYMLCSTAMRVSTGT